MAGHWTSREAVTSERAKRALVWGDMMAEIVSGKTGDTWDGLLPLIDEKRFVRRGNERKEMNWPTYRAMLDQWKEHSGGYEKKLVRASEVGDVVYLDLDERAVSKDGTETKLRSISIYEFDEKDRIVAVDLCMGFHQPG